MLLVAALRYNATLASLIGCHTGTGSAFQLWRPIYVLGLLSNGVPELTLFECRHECLDPPPTSCQLLLPAVFGAGTALSGSAEVVDLGIVQTFGILLDG
jgi:hypothetical protein